MTTHLFYDPLTAGYNLLENMMLRYKNMYANNNYDEMEHIDDMYAKLLNNNGNNIDDNTKMMESILNDNIHIVLLKNAMCNSATLYKDILQLYGTTYIFLFIDIFNPLFDNAINNFRPSEDEDPASFALGNNVYYAMIKDICNILCRLICPLSYNDLDDATVAGKLLFTDAPIYMAASILNQIQPLVEQDVDSELSIKAENIIDKINNIDINLLLLGLS